MIGKVLAPLTAALLLAAAAVLLAAPSDTTIAATPLDTEEQAFLTLINNYRQQNGRGALTVDTKLQDASEWMSIDLGVRVDRLFSHTDSLGRDPFVRMSAFGYNYNTWKGENLAAGPGASSAQTAFDLWRNSPGHNSNMLGSNYTAIGIARRHTAGSPLGWYWTTDFGGFVSSPFPPQSSATPTPSPTAAPTASPTAAPTDVPPRVLQSDVDCSGTVTAVDALIELRYVAQLNVSLDRYCSQAGIAGASAGEDVDCSNSVTSVDALKILRFVAGMPVDQTEPCPDIGTSLN
jgi:uncharacterized protein YkwD